jgi:hypothetical protein
VEFFGEKLKPDESIRARLMRDMTLPAGAEIHAGVVVIGHGIAVKRHGGIPMNSFYSDGSAET